VSIFQVLGLGITGVTATLLVIGALRRRLAPLPAAFWIMVFSAAAVAIAAPEITVLIANVLGISRGADLVFYCAILAMLFGFMRVQIQIRRLDQSITVLTRELALHGAGQKGNPGRAIAE
jgi:hypothetical protein